jgi:hypothetical protein
MKTQGSLYGKVLEISQICTKIGIKEVIIQADFQEFRNLVFMSELFSGVFLPEKVRLKWYTMDDIILYRAFCYGVRLGFFTVGTNIDGDVKFGIIDRKACSMRMGYRAVRGAGGLDSQVSGGGARA